MSRQISVAIVGAAHPNKDGGNRRSEIAFCNLGESLDLRPEPKNPHDEHAIAVFSARNFQIGYVASERAVYLGSLMRSGHNLKAVFQDIATWGAIARIGVDCDPALPTENLLSSDDGDGESISHNDDFYPDFLPPDD